MAHLNKDGMPGVNFTKQLVDAGAPDEAYGRVARAVDGDTFDIALQDYNGSQVSEDVIRIRLADIDTLEVRGPKACEAGKEASTYTRTWLQSTYVFLDLDDKTGKRSLWPMGGRGLSE